MFNSRARKGGAATRDMDPETLTAGAPVGGVNARDSLAQMPPTDCISAVNVFGTPSYVQIPRNGNELWASGLPGAVESVMAYNGLSGRKLFAASGNNIYDITAQGAVGSAVVSTTGNSRLQHAMFNAGGGNVLIWANGSVQPQFYNGSSWANTTITGSGLTPSNLITVTVFKQRVWYIENNTMNVWYSTILGFQGALTILPLGQLFKKGGTLVQMATWTIDNVSGMDDYAVFITSEGEVAVYQGYDPTQISTWSLVGIFTIGRPIGRRCYTKLAADILVITADGLTPLSKAMLTDRTQEDAQLTYKIINAINTDVQNYNANFGWQVIDYPLGNKLILNVPEASDGAAHQWVMNSVAQTWWLYRAWNAVCWELQQDALYYGENTQVFLADVGQADSGLAINIDCKPAFSYFNLPGKLKNFLLAQPIFQASAPITPQVTLNVDYADFASPSTPFSSGGVAPWDTSPWDITFWGDITPSLSIHAWQGIKGLGYAASGRLSMQLKGILAQWFATNYLYEDAGPL